MIIDILFLLAILAALINGFRKGLIVAIFSIIAFIIGIAAALKLSAVAANWLGQSTNIGAKWLPILGFIAIFIAVVLLVRIGAKFLEGVVNFAMMGWLNKLGGILLYIVLYTLLFSIFLFFTTQIALFSTSALEESVTYKWIVPWGPKTIDTIGNVIPWFKNMFTDLEAFFAIFNQKDSV